MEHAGLNISAFEVKHLPIVSAFAQKLGLVELIDQRVKGEMEISPGIVVLAMVLDALSGRSPLFRLYEFFENKDTELLLGKRIDPKRLSDWTLGRVLDRLYDYGTNKILSALAVCACKLAHVKDTFFHFDTTSLRVWGDYDPDHDDPFFLTRGYSKDKRPDLLQFILSMLSIKGGLPIRFSCEDGNQSDRTTSNNVLLMISDFLAENDFPGMTAFIADSVLITPDNMPLLQDMPFISRLPATYKEHSRVISQAIADRNWSDQEVLAQQKGTAKRPVTRYKASEATVTLYDHDYRAVVFHSSAHDARRIKRLERNLEEDRRELQKRCDELSRTDFFCHPDAQKAAYSLKPGTYHTVSTTIVEYPVYGRGRPPKDGIRTPVSFRYRIETSISENQETTARLMMEAGCFVLLAHKLDEMDSMDVLRAYKEQSAIEQGFRFLKDPMILDSLFLETPKRIEALGLVMVIALLIWRLMQDVMRRSIQKTGETVEGWRGRSTDKPTSFMMTTKFAGVTIVVVNNKRYLNDKLTEAQRGYLKHLELQPEIFTQFPSRDPP